MSRKPLATVALAVVLAIGSAGIALGQQEAGEAAARVEEGFDWGWLGLLGLIGLAGLAGRRHDRARTTTTTGTVR
jgi:hypothetical protein